ALIDRHPSLRTTYITFGEDPVQIVHEHQQVPFELIDASAWSQEDLHKRMFEEADRSFDLERGPILRAYLFSRSPQEYILWLLIHHIAVDFDSLETLIEELGVLYVSEKSGVLAPLPPLTSRYVDYIRWEAQMLASSEGKRHWTYLQKQLAGELPVLNLPTDRPRPPVQTYQTASLFSTLSTGLIQQIKAIAQTESTSLYATLVAAFFFLLYRYTSQENILLGASTEQGHTKFKGVTGYFVNQLPLRADLSKNPIFREFLRKIDQMVQVMFEHQDYPSHLLAKQLRISRDPSYPPLFQAIFMLQELHQRGNLSPFLLGQRGGQIKLDGLVMESMSLEAQMMIFVDLQLTIIEGYESFSALWQYNTDLFDAATIERMTGHFRTLLEGIVANPDQRISDISILTEAERNQLLVEWNDTNVDYPKDRCIHEVFEAQVEQTPNAVSVVFPSVGSGHGKEKQMTYRELNVRANQLAHYLRALKVGPDVVVGLCIERSLEMVVGLLGILKAGGAYVPLDPAYPQDRLLFMMENSQVPVLVTQDALVTELPDHEAHVICLDTDWHLISQERGDNLVSGVTPENLAYIIYTSGSTGMPKGVAMKHLALLNLILWHLEDAALSRSAKTLQFSPVSFDVSFQEIFSTWCTGGTLALISEDLRRDPVALLHFLRDNSVERLFLPFVALQQLCEVAEDSKLFPESLREVITAGEQLQITAPVD
ncbi:MAG: AMP-binding protein, partial [bacterium]|nr:AMP-binding protein [bacterium]